MKIYRNNKIRDCMTTVQTIISDMKWCYVFFKSTQLCLLWLIRWNLDWHGLHNFSMKSFLVPKVVHTYSKYRFYYSNRHKSMKFLPLHVALHHTRFITTIKIIILTEIKTELMSCCMCNDLVKYVLFSLYVNSIILIHVPCTFQSIWWW